MCETLKGQLPMARRDEGLSSRVVSCVTLLLLLVVSCCGVAVPIAERPAPVALGRDIPAYTAGEDHAMAGLPGVLEQPTGRLTLREALSLALLRNPELAAFSWEVRAREAHALQQGLLPNPEVSIEVENFAGTGDFHGFRAAETTTLLGQLIELGGKRQRRARVAVVEANLAGWDYEARRVEVLTAVTKAFVAVLAMQERLKLAEELVRVAARADQAVKERVLAGAAPLVDKARAEVALETSRLERNRLRRRLNAVRNRLAALWGSGRAEFAEVEGEFAAVNSPPPVGELAGMIHNTPAVARWETELEQRTATVSLEKAKRIPDLTIAGGVRRLSGTDTNTLVMEMSVPLPIFNWNQGEVREAESRLARGRRERRAAIVNAQAALNEVYERLAASFNEVVTLRDRLIPLAQKAFRRAEEAYRKGRFHYLEVLDAQRNLFELRSRYVGALATYYEARADVERLIGEPLDRAGRPEETR